MADKLPWEHDWTNTSLQTEIQPDKTQTYRQGEDMLRSLSSIMNPNTKNYKESVQAWANVLNQHGAKPPQLVEGPHSEYNAFTNRLNIAPGGGALPHELSHYDQIRNENLGNAASSFLRAVPERLIYGENRYNIPGTVENDAQKRMEKIKQEFKIQQDSILNENPSNDKLPWEHDWKDTSPEQKLSTVEPSSTATRPFVGEDRDVATVKAALGLPLEMAKGLGDSFRNVVHDVGTTIGANKEQPQAGLMDMINVGTTMAPVAKSALRHLAGRISTNVVDPFSYSMFKRIEDIKNTGDYFPNMGIPDKAAEQWRTAAGVDAPGHTINKFRDIADAIISDEPISNLRHLADPDLIYDSPETALREWAFRKMYGLKPREGMEDVLKNSAPEGLVMNPDKSYRFTEPEMVEELRERIRPTQSVMGNYNRQIVPHGFKKVKEEIAIHPPNRYPNVEPFNEEITKITSTKNIPVEAVRYKDVWDFNLNPGERAEKFRTIFGRIQPGKFPISMHDRLSALGEMAMRDINAALTKPVTFKGTVIRER